MISIRKCLGLSANRVRSLALRTGVTKFKGQFVDGRSQLLTLIRSKCSTTTDETSSLAKMGYTTYQHPQHNKRLEDPPIIILHGLLGSKSNWASMAKGLLNKTKNRRVITMDLRNHGDSTHSFEFTYELMATDLVKFMHGEFIPKATFIGHSLGGRVCMLLAMIYPILVENLIVVDISPVGQSPNMLGLLNIFRAIRDLDIDPFVSVAEARKEAAVQLKETIKDDDIVKFILTNLTEHHHKSNWRWKFNIESIIGNFNTEICRFPVLDGKYTGPTLFVGGGKSDYLKVEQEPVIRDIFPSAEFQYIPGAGHWVHAEKPHDFLAIVSKFINETGPQ